MQGERASIIVNPVSGRGGGLESAAVLARSLGAGGISARIFPTEATGHAISLARERIAAGDDLLIAAGGDGTINEVAHGLLTSTAPATPLAFMNTGTGGDFARMFNLQRDPEALARRIVAAGITRVDAGRISCRNDLGEDVDRYFVNIASAGFTGDVVRAVNASALRGRAPVSLIFPLYIVSGLARFAPYRLALVFDGGERMEVTCAAVVVANGRFFGGGLAAAPLASIQDGLLDVVVLPARGRLNLIASLKLIRRGAHLDEPDVIFRRVRNLTVSQIAGNPPSCVWIEADGETPGHLAATFAAVPQALNVRL